MVEYTSKSFMGRSLLVMCFTRRVVNHLLDTCDRNSNKIWREVKKYFEDFTVDPVHYM